MSRTISLGEVEYIIFRLTRELMAYDEPIPDFATRFPNVLESCLAVPFQRFEKKSLYKTLSQKAAILFYLMVKNHPFQNLPAPQAGQYVVYALKCSDNSIYIGQTDNLPRRMKEHEKGSNFYTRSRLPVQIVYIELFKTREIAVAREKKLKTGFGRKWLRKYINLQASRQAGGNKRIAMTTLFYFLFKNKKWLRVDEKKLYNFAVWVAQSPAELKKETLEASERFIRTYLMPLR